MDKVILQEKTDEELNEYSNKIIDMLKDLNISEKYKVISCLYNSLVDTIKDEGGMIVEKNVG